MSATKHRHRAWDGAGRKIPVRKGRKGSCGFFKNVGLKMRYTSNMWLFGTMRKC